MAQKSRFLAMLNGTIHVIQVSLFWFESGQKSDLWSNYLIIAILVIVGGNFGRKSIALKYAHNILLAQLEIRPPSNRLVISHQRRYPLLILESGGLMIFLGCNKLLWRPSTTLNILLGQKWTWLENSHPMVSTFLYFNHLVRCEVHPQGELCWAWHDSVQV